MKDMHLEDLFYEHLARFSESERKIIYRKLSILQENPEHNSLRRQKLRGIYKTWFESSISMGIRVVWRYNEDKSVIIVKDIGRHDIMKKYG